MSDQNIIKIAEFRKLVHQERQSQLEKWGSQIHSSPEWIAILGEEFGEAAAACCDQWIQGEDKTNLLKELVQVAAVAEAAFTDLSNGDS